MGFLDKAKKLAEQAKELAEGALADAKAQTQSSSTTSTAGSTTTSGELGTPYVPGMLGRPGWRERGLEDPAAVLPIAERDRVGIPHSTKSQIVEEPFGMGRRWSAGGRSLGLFHQLYPEQEGWQPPNGSGPIAEVAGTQGADLPDGRSLAIVTGNGRRVVLELNGFDPAARAQLAAVVANRL